MDATTVWRVSVMNTPHPFPRLLVLGAHGQVGRELVRSLAPLGEVIALTRRPGDHEQGWFADLSDPVGLVQTIERLQPNWVINAAAYTAVDEAQSASGQLMADRVNHQSVAALAQCCVRLGAGLVHYSTDYVFNGQGQQAWKETDPPHPVNAYGLSKQQGEGAVVQAGGKYVVMRTSWVYGLHGNNFAKTMLRLAMEREQLRVVADQVGAPTSAALLADLTAHVIRQMDDVSYEVPAHAENAAVFAHPWSGIYHVCASGSTSWHGYAQRILQWASAQGWPLKVTADSVQAIASSEYPTAAPRPLNSRLNTELFVNTFGLCLPDWQQGVVDMLNSLHPSALK